MPAPVTRRSLLRGGLGLVAAAGTAPLLTGCGHRRAAPPRPFDRPTAAPRGVPAAAQAAEQALLAAYTATAGRHPGLAPVLAVPLAHHREHASLLGTPRDQPSPPPVTVPDDQRAALQALLALEAAAADARDAEAVQDRRHGALLGSVGAAEAVHADLLETALGAGSLPPGPVPGPGPGQAAPGAPAREVDALRSLAAREHAVVYGVAAAGGRLSAAAGSPQQVQLVRAAYDTHRLLRDALAEALRDRGAPVPAAEPGYLLPPAADASGTLGFVAGLEDAAADGFAGALADLSGADVRQLTIGALRGCARSRTRLLLSAGRAADAAAQALPGSTG